jgi:hypothetical protein
MTGRTLLKLAFPAACVACLAAGFASAGRWTALAAVALAGLTWLAAVRWHYRFLPHSALALSVGSAAAGLLLSAPAALMMIAAACALAGWDGILFRRIPVSAEQSEAASLLIARHYRSLLPALGAGLAVSIIGPLVSFRISFWWMMLVAALGLAGLEALRRMLGEKGADDPTP